jgi:hypothetical protein
MGRFIAAVLAVLVVAQACDGKQQETEPTLGELLKQGYVITGEYGLGLIVQKKGEPLGYTCESGMRESKRDRKRHCKRQEKPMMPF